MRELEVDITELDDEGSGVGRVEARELHVAGALPGERVRACVEHESPHGPRAWATLRGLVGEPSSERVLAACRRHGECGGCVLQHLAYPAQLTYKRQRVERALAAHPALEGLPVPDVVASPHELHYRNKAKYVLAPRPGGGILCGSYAPGTHRVVDMEGCLVSEEPIDRVAHEAARRLVTEGISLYDERHGKGELRHLVVRRNAEGQLLVVVVARSGQAQPALARMAAGLCHAQPEVESVVLNVHPKPGGAILGPVDLVLCGPGSLRDRVGEVSLELSARAFFQVNRAQAARLYADVARLALAGQRTVRAVDLCTGVGGIALTLGQRGARVVGVESNAAAIEDASASAQAAGMAERAQFLCADLATGLPQAMTQVGGADVVVVNPPRKGLGERGRAAFAQALPARIIYVSCGPESLATDLAALCRTGYEVSSLRPYDLLPGTPHVEVVVSLVSKLAH
jgi:23S rRNA (uracil1939-C5)-methyltransferase